MAQPVLRLVDAALSYGARPLWSGLNLDVQPGEFLAVLGGNGSGKTSLLRTILGLQRLTAGELLVDGRPVRGGSRGIGYIPQQRRFDPLAPLRAKDVVRQGIDGHRWGFARPGHVPWDRIDELLASVGARHLADTPTGTLSGGEYQRVRVAQALAADPTLLLCDEPLLSLDLASQHTITRLIDQRRREHGTAVVFVTHEINPILPYADRVLYLAHGRFSIGTVDEVLTSETLSALYGVPIDVIRTAGRIVVVGVPDTHHEDDDANDEAVAS